MGQIQALERLDPEFRDRHIEVHYPGEPVAVYASTSSLSATASSAEHPLVRARPNPSAGPFLAQKLLLD